MMDLMGLVGLRGAPEPWAEGEKIPWDNPGFSARMLKEHLSQDHDAASRRMARIERQVEWIHGHIMNGEVGRILDLGCGPGLYAHLLAGLGHDCVGIDFSPASIAHARAKGGVFVEADVRAADFGQDRDLVMMLFGELNVFKVGDAQAIVAKARRALRAGGRLVLEVHTEAGVRAIGEGPKSWRVMAQGGLFSERPHLWLSEGHWHEASASAVERHVIVDLGEGSVEVYGATTQAYSPQRYQAMLEAAGFVEVERHPSLGEGEGESDFEVLCARAGG